MARSTVNLPSSSTGIGLILRARSLGMPSMRHVGSWSNRTRESASTVGWLATSSRD